MSEARRQLAEWFESFWDEKLPAEGKADLFERFDIEGDDASEFMEAFASRFAVNADNYRWYFHHGEEGTNFGGLFFRPPNMRVQRIPITPDILVQAIEQKSWPLEYPPHEPPAVRWDIKINQLSLVVPVILLGLWLWKRFI